MDPEAAEKIVREEGSTGTVSVENQKKKTGSLRSTQGDSSEMACDGGVGESDGTGGSGGGDSSSLAVGAGTSPSIEAASVAAAPAAPKVSRRTSSPELIMQMTEHGLSPIKTRLVCSHSINSTKTSETNDKPHDAHGENSSYSCGGTGGGMMTTTAEKEGRVQRGKEQEHSLAIPWQQQRQRADNSRDNHRAGRPISPSFERDMAYFTMISVRFRELMERRERRLEEALADPSTRSDLETMFPSIKYGDYQTLLAGVRGMEEEDFQTLLHGARKRRHEVCWILVNMQVHTLTQRAPSSSLSTINIRYR